MALCLSQRHNPVAVVAVSATTYHSPYTEILVVNGQIAVSKKTINEVSVQLLTKVFTINTIIRIQLGVINIYDISTITVHLIAQHTDRLTIVYISIVARLLTVNVIFSRILIDYKVLCNFLTINPFCCIALVINHLLEVEAHERAVPAIIKDIFFIKIVISCPGADGFPAYQSGVICMTQRTIAVKVAERRRR